MRKFALGMAAGLGAAVVAARLARARFAISFEGRVVIITGGSRGLGLVMARRLVDEGARVVLLARDLEELGRARDELLARGTGDVMTIRCDVRRRAEVQPVTSPSRSPGGYEPICEYQRCPLSSARP